MRMRLLRRLHKMRGIERLLKQSQSIDKVDALPSKVSKQTFDGNINFL